MPVEPKRNPQKLKLYGYYVECKVCKIWTDHVNRSNEYIGLCALHDPLFDPDERKYLDKEREVDLKAVIRNIIPIKEKKKDEKPAVTEFKGDSDVIIDFPTKGDVLLSIEQLTIDDLPDYTCSRSEIEYFEESNWDEIAIEDYIESQRVSAYYGVA